jgi:hypothetical protein
MKDDKVVDNVIFAAAVVILAPIVIGGVITLGSCVYAGVANTINKVKYNKKIKKGLKDGSIIEIDGEYYEAKVELKEED